LLPGRFFRNQWFRDTIPQLIGPTIEGRLRHTFPKAIQVNAQTAGLLTLQPLLPIQMLI
jgi:hypothetical protein